MLLNAFCMLDVVCCTPRTTVLEALVGSVMRTPVVIAREDEDSALTLERMRTHGVRRIPVVGRQGTLVGVVTADDMLRRLAADAGLLTEIVSRQQSLEERRVR